jgi:hypothetical protein
MTSREKALKMLDEWPSAPWLPPQALVGRLARFGFGDRWTLALVREWMRTHSYWRPSDAFQRKGKFARSRWDRAMPEPNRNA